MTVYKIRDKHTGKFSTGGASPQWTSIGKTWNSIAHVKTHLLTWKNLGRPKEIPGSWEIVVYEVAYAGAMPAAEALKP